MIGVLGLYLIMGGKRLFLGCFWKFNFIVGFGWKRLYVDIDGIFDEEFGYKKLNYFLEDDMMDEVINVLDVYVEDE